jgi:hypothetical protein
VSTDVTPADAPPGPGAREALPVVAVGAAACVACCAPPILGALGLTVGLSGLAWLAGGLLAAVVVAAVGTGVVIRRRRAAA